MREAATLGAQVILPSELFQGPYFCVTQEERWFATAHPWREHPCVTALAPLAAELGVVIPISIYEREGPHYYNKPGDGRCGRVRSWASTARATFRTGPGYQEKYYFRPGDTRLQGLGHASRSDRRRDLLGPVVPRGRPRHGPRKGRRC